MASFCLSGEDKLNKVWHDCFGHVIPLVPVQASHDTGGSVSAIILFLRSCDASVVQDDDNEM